MKLVFTAAEVAEALQISVEELLSQLPTLEANGFPQPLPGLEQRWSIIDIVNWVNSSVRVSPPHQSGSWPAVSPRLS